MQNNPTPDNFDNLLNSIDGITRAEAPPFLYTRVLAKMQRTRSSSFWEKISWLLSKPKIAFACICMIILINLFAVLSQTQPATDGIVSDDYAQVSNSYDDLENPKP